MTLSASLQDVVGKGFPPLTSLKPQSNRQVVLIRDFLPILNRFFNLRQSPVPKKAVLHRANSGFLFGLLVG